MNSTKQAPAVVGIAFELFADVEDPRIERRKLHPLMNVLVMALCGALAGANGWDELAVFSRTHRSWFATFLEMPHGTPSADTFRRVFEALDPRELDSALRNWVAAVGKSLEGELVAIDGKSLKGAINKAGSTTPLHLLHAWAVDQRLLLGQQLVDGAPGEVAAIPELLGRLKIDGAVVTTDANGCTKKVTEAIRGAKADYVLALKGNRGPLHRVVKELFERAHDKQFRRVATHRSKDKNHGRLEKRVVRALKLREVPEGWCDLKTAVMVERTRTVGDATTLERHYYIASIEPDAEKIGQAIRAHWGIENGLHWMLDVAFDEDSRRIRDVRSAENYALVTRIALMMLKRSPERLSGALKRKKAGWDTQYLGQLLGGGL